MSLLMDALRKAEQQKQRLGNAEPTDPDAGLALEPLAAEAALAPPSPMTPASKLPELPSHLEDLDEQFLSHAQQPPAKVQAAPVETPKQTPPKPQAVAADKAPEIARNLFEAKQPARRSNRSFAIAVGALGFFAAIGIGAYFWWQLQPKGALLSGGAPLPAQPTAVARPTPQQEPPPAAPAPSSASSVATAAAPSIPPLASSAATQTPAGRLADGGEDDSSAVTRPAVPQAARQAAASELPQSPVRVTKAQGKADASLDQAHAAFSRGENDQARSLWQKKLALDPLNSDALHGMALLALRQHDNEAAVGYYRRALDANPKDALALSALASLNPPTDPLQAESHLKTLLAEQPNSPHLNFALGNLYSRSARWPEAQQAYFKAHVADPANPDYLFNLAVSLDQLRQASLAIQYYTRALAAAEQQSASFSPAQVAARLKILQSSLLH